MEINLQNTKTALISIKDILKAVEHAIGSEDQGQ